MTVMNRLPTVISCCFCCFLRAGTLLIAIFSFIVGLILAPNVVHTKGFWYIDPEPGVLSNYGTAIENVIRVTLGAVSIMLCVVSVMLLIGAICNIPKLIEVYQWGALVYCITTFLIFFVLAIMCFLVHESVASGFILLGMVIIDVLLSAYFIIVTNSLRVSVRYLHSSI